MSTVGLTVTCTYTTPGADSFTVPTGDAISSINVVVIGAGGGGNISNAGAPAGTLAPGGSGAKVTATLVATGGDIEGIDVGTGGGPGTNLGSSGGGASSTVDADAANQVIAGGGGGASDDAGGGDAGQPGPADTVDGCSTGGGSAGGGGTGGAVGNPSAAP
jgi:hypothetical protein